MHGRRLNPTAAGVNQQMRELSERQEHDEGLAGTDTLQVDDG